MQSVKIGCSLSDLMPIEIGIPQGSILGPLLFIVFVNDLPDCVTCKTVMYADDTALLVRSSDPSCLQSSNHNMSRIADWFRENKLTLNLSKTKLTLFGTPYYLGKFENISLVYNGEEIEKVDYFKYLGLIFDSNMTWSHHIDLLLLQVFLNIVELFVVSNVIFQILFLKSLLNLLSCHTLIIVVMFGLTVLLLFPVDYKLLWITLKELSFQLT